MGQTIEERLKEVEVTLHKMYMEKALSTHTRIVHDIETEVSTGGDYHPYVNANGDPGVHPNYGRFTLWGLNSRGTQIELHGDYRHIKQMLEMWLEFMAAVIEDVDKAEAPSA